jgi:4-amino-4-deoxy-L-arabinose transferase-like glycosyltransferase
VSSPAPSPAVDDARRPGLLTALVLLLVLALGAHLRLRAAHETVVWPPLQGDSVRYVAVAYNLRHFGTVSQQVTWNVPDAPAPKPDALSPPGYPALLWTVLADAPDVPFLQRALLLQALLGLLAVGLGYLLARPLLPRAAALAVAALLAIAPQLVTLGTSLLTETLYTALVAAFAVALAHAARRERLSAYAVAGVLLGLCALVRPTLQYLPVLLLPAIAWLATRERWKACGVLLLAYALTFGPWLVRNRIVVGGSDSTLMANTLLHGSYPDFRYAGRAESTGFPYRFDPQAASIRTPGQALDRIGANFAADPAGTLRWYLVGKPLRFHDWAFVEGAGDVFINSVKASPYFTRPEFIATHVAMRWLHLPLMLLGAAGLALALVGVARRDRSEAGRALGLLAVTLAFAIALHMVGLPLARYAVPFRPLTFLFALYAIVAIVRALRRRAA